MWLENKLKFKLTVKNIPEEEELKIQYINQYWQKKRASVQISVIYFEFLRLVSA